MLQKIQVEIQEREKKVKKLIEGRQLSDQKFETKEEAKNEEKKSQSHPVKSPKQKKKKKSEGDGDLFRGMIKEINKGLLMKKIECDNKMMEAPSFNTNFYKNFVRKAFYHSSDKTVDIHFKKYLLL